MTRTPNKWDREFAADLAERVGATFLGALTTALVATGTDAVDWTDGKIVWAILGVPTLFSLIKGLSANIANGDSGASLLPVPPGPDVNAG